MNTGGVKTEHGSALAISSTTEGFEGDILSVAFSTDGKLVACGDTSGAVKVYTAAAGTLASAVTDPSTGGSPCTSVKFFPAAAKDAANQLIATYTSGHAITWHASSKIKLRVYETEGLLCGDIRPDGKQYAVGGMSQDVEIVDVATNVCVTKLGMGGMRVASELDRPPAGHGSRIFSVKYHPVDEHIVVSGGWDRIVVVWDVRESEPLRYFSGVFVCGDSLSLDHTGTTLLTGAYQKKEALRVWDFADPKKQPTTLSHALEESWVYCCKFATGSSEMVGQVGTLSNEARLVATDTKATIGRFVDERALFAMDFNHDNTMMAVGGASRRLILLNVDKEGSAAPSTLVSEEEMYLGASKGKPKWKPTPPPPEFSFDDPGSDDGESDDED